ncbi:hypothetical protein BC828DRAFT_400423, partial [Blastocladiella britannica]
MARPTKYLLAALLLAASLAVTVEAAPAQIHPKIAVPTENALTHPNKYIVQFTEAPIVNRSSGKVSTQALARAQKVRAQHASFKAAAAKVNVKVERTFQKVFNGAAVHADNQADLIKLAQQP